MSEHTPGPWVISKRMRDPGCIVIHTPEGRSIASAWCLLGPNNEPADTPMEANARLIAAAPELLAALEEIVKDGQRVEYHRNKRVQHHASIARAAIAKARGQ